MNFCFFPALQRGRGEGGRGGGERQKRENSITEQLHHSPYYYSAVTALQLFYPFVKCNAPETYYI